MHMTLYVYLHILIINNKGHYKAKRKFKVFQYTVYKDKTL